MAATQPQFTPDPDRFAANMAKVAEQCQLIWREYLGRQQATPTMPGGSDPLNIAGAFAELFARLMNDPERLAKAQFDLWQGYMNLWQSTSQRWMGEKAAPVIEPDARDKRFKDAAWQDSTVFDFLKQSYLLSARAMHQAVSDVKGINPHTAKKVDFYTRQFIDAMAPSNFVMTNPEVLRTTIESNGDNLVKGLRHVLEDIEKGNGQLKISMTGNDVFELGRNLAITPGKVVYQNDLMQLIQYTPVTEKTYKTPLLIIPAWINKYYILDMRPENSYVRWALEQGYTVFMISWVNPNRQLTKKSFEDYLSEGPLAALDAIEKTTGERQVNAVGYCLGGTLLASTLAYLQAKKKQSRITSATFLTTLVDFKDVGELSVFIDEEQIDQLERKMSQQGFLDGSEMATVFSMLRANDLIWSFVVNNYLLGRDPFPFDLLYWNADSTRLPAAMHSFYLRNMYQKNLLAKPDGITLLGTKLDLGNVKTPVYILSCKEDHIAPWQSTYAATQLYKGPVRFVLSGSGHVAGVVNPPAKQKYGYRTASKLPESPEAWFAASKETPGSWWLDWEKWQRKHAGVKVKARFPGKGKLKAIENAPGSYVKVKA